MSSAEPAQPHSVCPWWIGYLLASPLRRIFQRPERILAPYVRQGMTVLEPGPGMGFFTLELARLVGETGRVVAVDIQPRMLEALRRRAAKAGVGGRIDARLSAAESLNIADLAGKVDFTLAFAVVHEMPGVAAFFRDVARATRPGGRVLFAEPGGHVNERQFASEVQAAGDAGFSTVETPSLPRSRTVVLELQHSQL